jgi:hypothetical protein
MYTISAVYKQIYSSLLHHRQFPNPVDVYPNRSGWLCLIRLEIETELADLLKPLARALEAVN